MADDPWALFNPQPAPAAAPDPWAAFNPQPAGGVGTALASGAERGVAALPFAPGVAAEGIGRLISKASGGWLIPTDEQIAQKYKELQAQHPDQDIKPPLMATDLMGSAIGGIQSLADVAARKLGYGGDLSQYQPKTGTEEVAQDVGAFLPTIAANPLSATSAAGKLGEIGTRALTRGVVPGTTTYIGGQVAPKLGIDKETGELLGGVAAGPIEAAAVPAAKAVARVTALPFLGSPAKMTPELQEAVTNAASGYQGAQAPYMPIGAATDQPGVRYGTAPLVHELPGANLVQAASAQRSINQIGDYASGLAKATGASNPTSAGETLIKNMHGWFSGDSKTQVRDAYDAVGADPTIRQQPSNVASTLQSIIDERKNAGLPEDTGLMTALDAATNPNGLDYAGTKLQRTALRLNPPGSLLPGEYDQLYDAWTKDLNSVAAANGPDVAAQHQVANDLALSVGNRRKAMGKMLGMSSGPGAAPTVSPEQMFGRIQSYAQEGPGANIDKLLQIKGTLGAQDWQEVAGTVGQQLGLDPTGKFDLDTFARNYAGLSNDGKNVLFGTPTTPGFRNAYDALAAYSSRGKVLAKQAGPSWQSLGLGGVAELGGLYFEPMATLAATGGGLTLSGLLARPATAASVARWAKTGQAYSMAQHAGNATQSMLRNLYGASRNLQNTAAAAGIRIPESVFGMPMPASLPPSDQGQQQ